MSNTNVDINIYIKNIDAEFNSNNASFNSILDDQGISQNGACMSNSDASYENIGASTCSNNNLGNYNMARGLSGTKTSCDSNNGHRYKCFVPGNTSKIKPPTFSITKTNGQVITIETDGILQFNSANQTDNDSWSTISKASWRYDMKATNYNLSSLQNLYSSGKYGTSTNEYILSIKDEPNTIVSEPWKTLFEEDLIEMTVKIPDDLKETDLIPSDCWGPYDPITGSETCIQSCGNSNNINTTLSCMFSEHINMRDWCENMSLSLYNQLLNYDDGTFGSFAHLCSCTPPQEAINDYWVNLGLDDGRLGSGDEMCSYYPCNSMRINGQGLLAEYQSRGLISAGCPNLEYQVCKPEIDLAVGGNVKGPVNLSTECQSEINNTESEIEKNKADEEETSGFFNTKNIIILSSVGSIIIILIVILIIIGIRSR